MVKTIKTEIKLYEYKELDEKAKETAFNSHLNFLYENPAEYEDEDENGNIITKYDNMDEWTGEELKKYVEESIEINKYLFFKDGKMADIIHFTDKHKKAGTTEFYLGGKTYILN